MTAVRDGGVVSESIDVYRVLVVDDDVVDRMTIARALRAAPIRAEIVEADGEQRGLHALDASPIDCVVLDYHLPGTDGLAVLRAIRRRGHTTPVIVLTGQTDTQTAAELIKAGASDYLMKGQLGATRLAHSIQQSVRARRAEDRARALEQLQRSILDAVPSIVWSCDASGRIEHVNDRWVAVTGAAPTTLGEDTLHRHVHPDDVASVASTWAASIQAGEPWEHAYRLRTATGQYRWYLGRSLPVRDAAGRVTRWIGSATDIDDEKRAAAALAEANRAKDVFLATISHELRTPLTAILGWIRLARGPDVARPRLERALETIERNALLQSQLIEDLLDVARIATGKLRLTDDDVDVARIAETAVESLRAQAEAKGVSLDAHVLARPIVRGDGVRLHQVVTNLVGNAIKFTDAGGAVRVELSIDAGRACITVSDTGKGIAPDLLPHVFEPFRQGELSPSQGGLGLGLAIVRHIVEAHGGTIDVASLGRGLGASFSARLPCTEPSGREDPEAAPHSDVRGEIRGRRVLVVDADRDSRELLTRLIEQAGAHAIAVSSPREALACLEHERLDAILIDVSTAERGAYDVLDAIRESTVHRSAPVVALTGSARDDERIRALAAGFDLHLPKPVDAAALQTAIESLDRRAAS